jgi:hypothetical protein
MAILYFLFLQSFIFGATPLKTHNATAFYWGQNAYGGQQRLKEYCVDGVDIMILSFVHKFGRGVSVSNDYSNQCFNPNYFSGTEIVCVYIFFFSFIT